MIISLGSTLTPQIGVQSLCGQDCKLQRKVPEVTDGHTATSAVVDVENVDYSHGPLVEVVNEYPAP